nr:MAG TPA: hypothetical protein [Caudoviricetes sp.]
MPVLDIVKCISSSLTFNTKSNLRVSFEREAEVRFLMY